MSPLLAYLILAAPFVLALIGFTLPRSWTQKRHGCLRLARIGLLLLGLVGILSSGSRIIWDGGYLRAEYQITFRDLNNLPIEGIELRVEDKAGHTFYYYPVSDFRPDGVSTSDSGGLMVFHHLGEGVEFGGKEWYLYFLFPVEERPGPDYVCRFLYRGQEVYRVSYGGINLWHVVRSGEHISGWEEMEKVTRLWKRPDWPPCQLLLAQEEGHEDYYTRIRKLFDLDGDGKLNPEEGAAYHAATNYRSEEAAIARLKGEDPKEEVAFAVVRRTVILPLNRER